MLLTYVIIPKVLRVEKVLSTQLKQVSSTDMYLYENEYHLNKMCKYLSL